MVIYVPLLSSSPRINQYIDSLLKSPETIEWHQLYAEKVRTLRTRIHIRHPEAQSQTELICHDDGLTADGFVIVEFCPWLYERALNIILYVTAWISVTTNPRSVQFMLMYHGQREKDSKQTQIST